MKALLASLATAAVLVGGAAAGVPNDIAALWQSDSKQDARITALEIRVAKLEGKKARHPHWFCRPVAGQPIPEQCR